MEQQEKQPLKVCIVGKATSSRHLAPYDDPSWSVWVLSDNYQYCPRWDKWFELHSIEEGRQRWRSGYWETMLANQERLVIQHEHPDLPKATVYPIDTVLEQFGDYFTNSVSYMLAYAILAGATEISLFGVDMAMSDPARGNNGEYEHQRPSCEYMIGVAIGRGIGVTIPDQSDLMKCHRLYAFESHRGTLFQKSLARVQELTQRANSAAQREEQAKYERISCQAAAENMKYWYRFAGDGDHSPMKQRRENMRLKYRVQALEKELAALKGTG